MNTIKTSAKLIAALSLAASGALAQTTWTGSGDGLDWSDAGNWSNGVPGTSNGAVFNISTGATGLFEDYSILSLTFTGSVAQDDEIAGVGGAGLTIGSGGISNSTTSRAVISAAVTANANSTWDGPIKFANNVNLGVRQVTLSDAITFTGTNLNFDINTTAAYGRFLGTGVATYSGVTINFFGTYTNAIAVAGDTFDFTTGSFTGATLNVASLPTLSAPLHWDTTQFISQGILTVVGVPEPSTWAALAGVAVLGVAASRRRRTA